MQSVQVQSDPLDEAFRQAELWRQLRGRSFFPKLRDDPAAQAVEGVLLGFIDGQLARILGRATDAALTPDEVAQVRALLSGHLLSPEETLAIRMMATRLLSGGGAVPHRQESSVPSTVPNDQPRRLRQIRPRMEHEELDGDEVAPLTLPVPTISELEMGTAAQAAREEAWAIKQMDEGGLRAMERNNPERLR